MTDHHACEDREELIAYLYDECDEAGGARIAAHLALCDACRAELDALAGVRRTLGAWTPPGEEPGFVLVPRATAASWRTWKWSGWRVPLAAAASVLVLAGAAGLAHIEVRYGPEGVIVRTGWTSAPAAPAAVQTAAPADDAPWRPELSAFEAHVEQQLKAAPASPASAPTAVVDRLPAQAGLLQQVHSLVQASEERQQRQFALRLTEAMRELESERRADLVRIDQNFGQIEGTTGAAVAQQRELWNYLVRVAQHQQ